MKLKTLIAVLAVLAIFTAACGSDTEATVTGAAADSVDDDAMEDDQSTEESVEDEAMDDETMADDSVEEDVIEEDVMDDEMRIVSLSPTATEMLFAIGAGDLVVAADAFSNYPADAPTTELSGFEPNVEAIAGYEPTLVVSQAPIEGLDALGIENMVLGAAVTFDDVYAQIEQLGEKTDHIGDAAEVVGNMQSDIDAVLASLPERETALTYFHELDPTLYSVTSSTFIGAVYALLGLENAADPADASGEAFGYPQLTEEYLIDADPDIIFLADTKCCEMTAEKAGERPSWDQLTAVQSGNVIELDDDIASRWGPRLVDFIEVAGLAISSIEVAPAG